MKKSDSIKREKERSKSPEKEDENSFSVQNISSEVKKNEISSNSSSSEFDINCNQCKELED